MTRPAVKAGAIRIAAGQEEHHTAENTSSTPTDFLRIMFKTDNGGVTNLRQRMPPTEVDFANKQMRITRLRVKPGQNLLIEAKDASGVANCLARGCQAVDAAAARHAAWLDKGTTENSRSPATFRSTSSRSNS